MRIRRALPQCTTAHLRMCCKVSCVAKYVVLQSMFECVAKYLVLQNMFLQHIHVLQSVFLQHIRAKALRHRTPENILQAHKCRDMDVQRHMQRDRRTKSWTERVSAGGPSTHSLARHSSPSGARASSRLIPAHLPLCSRRVIRLLHTIEASVACLTRVSRWLTTRVSPLLHLLPLPMSSVHVKHLAARAKCLMPSVHRKGLQV